jgi:hypothetical protein
MKIKSLLVVSFSLATLGFSLPSLAIDGRTAVGQCIDSGFQLNRLKWRKQKNVSFT